MMLLCMGTAFPAAQLEKYRAQIAVSSPQTADVSVSVEMKGIPNGTKSLQLVSRLVRYPQQEIAQLTVENASGQLLPVTIVPVDGALEVRLIAGVDPPSQYS